MYKRQVLLTGGDAFMLSNSEIKWLLEQLEQIPHVEIKRFGTRTPVTPVSYTHLDVYKRQGLKQ